MAGPESARRYHWPRLDDEAGRPCPEFVPLGIDRAASYADAQHPSPDESAAPTDEGGTLADRTPDHAGQQAEALRRQAAEQAAEARRRLAEAVRAVTDQQLAAFQAAREQLLQDLRTAYQHRLGEIEQEMLSLIAAMAEKVVRRKLEADDQVVLEVVRETLAQAAGANQVTVRVSPAEQPLVQEAQQLLLSALGPVDELQIVADDNVLPGGCLVETERGRFDARVDTQLQVLSEELERFLKAG